MLWKCFLERAGYVRYKSFEHCPPGMVVVVLIRTTTCKRHRRLGLLAVSFPHIEGLVEPVLGFLWPPRPLLLAPPNLAVYNSATVVYVSRLWEYVDCGGLTGGRVQLGEGWLVHWNETLAALWVRILPSNSPSMLCSWPSKPGGPSSWVELYCGLSMGPYKELVNVYLSWIKVSETKGMNDSPVWMRNGED